MVMIAYGVWVTKKGFAIILLRKRECFALLCLLGVMWLLVFGLFLMLSCVGLQFVIDFLDGLLTYYFTSPI